jgi:glycosyltransferase involved in cell wall biosynthesis
MFLAPADFSVVPTQASRAHVDSLAGRQVPARMLLNPVDLSRLPDGTSHSRPRAVFLGDLSRRKGFDVLSESAIQLRAQGVETHAWGRDVDGLGDAAIDIALHGSAPLKEILPLLRSTDVLVIPSRVDPAPLTYSEALALGLRVVVSKTIAYAGHASATAGAIVSDCSSPRSLARAIIDALEAQRPDPASSRQVTPAHFGTSVVDALLGSPEDAA